MQQHMSRGIKDIIAEFPQIARILEEYGINCGSCGVGICELKDILEIHKLSPEAAKELTRRIEAAIHSGETPAMPPRHAGGRQDRPLLSAPLQVLVDEHRLIIRLLAQIPTLTAGLNLNSTTVRQTIEGVLEFIRFYADQRHHGKEEDILFSRFDVSGDIFRAFYEEHRKGRQFFQDMQQALAKGNAALLSCRLLEYAALLHEHIQKEDQVLFPWLDGRLSDQERKEIFAEFIITDGRPEMDDARHRTLVEQLETLFPLGKPPALPGDYNSLTVPEK
ncbi:MAG: hypothetical protein F9K32_05705 [Desulfobulbaceae bacterium]|nr:MAG: hypothetical protein F9K32_05705 [Desulfobulbaceae bacterium]